jgi:ATP-binding cassette, subfamily C, bacterial exporter for protease/lipase
VEGQLKMYGPTAQVLAALQGAPAQQAAAQAAAAGPAAPSQRQPSAANTADATA